MTESAIEKFYMRRVFGLHAAKMPFCSIVILNYQKRHNKKIGKNYWKSATPISVEKDKDMRTSVRPEVDAPADSEENVWNWDAIPAESASAPFISRTGTRLSSFSFFFLGLFFLGAVGSGIYSCKTFR